MKKWIAILLVLILAVAVAACGANTPKATIPLEDAVKTALTDAGLSEDQVTFSEKKSDTENGVPVYQVDFFTAETEYEYEIDAADGSILKKESKSVSPANSAGTDAVSGATPDAQSGATPDDDTVALPEGSEAAIQAAQQIALADTGLSADAVTFGRVKQDTEHGVAVWEIDFYSGGTVYEYKISVEDGSIVEKESEPAKALDANKPSKQNKEKPAY